MKILIFNWKDLKNSKSGGAELVTQKIAERFVRDGHKVTIICSRFRGAKEFDNCRGVRIIRLGNKWTIYWEARSYYKKNLEGKFDLVIDEINTIPFLAKFYAKERNILFVHQLCREIWFYEMFFPLNIIGFIIEPLYLWLLRDRQVVTVSESTKRDLLKYGFKGNNINIISEGIDIEPVIDLNRIKKFNEPTILSLGEVRSMKKTDHIIKAFILAKKEIKNLRLIVAGGIQGKYEKKIKRIIDNSGLENSIKCLGRVREAKKLLLLQKSHLICATSVKEGWGLIIVEAGSQGTPAIVYDSDGLRDSVYDNMAGIICKRNTPRNLSENIINLLNDNEKYRNLQCEAWKKSKKLNFDKCYMEFRNIVQNFYEKY